MAEQALNFWIAWLCRLIWLEVARMALGHKVCKKGLPVHYGACLSLKPIGRTAKLGWYEGLNSQCRMESALFMLISSCVSEILMVEIYEIAFVQWKSCCSWSFLCLLLFSIAIGREGGVGPLIMLARSNFEVCFKGFEMIWKDYLLVFLVYVFPWFCLINAEAWEPGACVL